MANPLLEAAIMSELHYVAWAGSTPRWAGPGAIGRAQNAALSRGWLARHRDYLDVLVLTASGRLALDEAEAA